MIPVSNLLIDLLYCHQKKQNDTMYALQVIHQVQRDHANDSLIDNILTFSGKPKFHFNWISKLENIAKVYNIANFSLENSFRLPLEMIL